MITHEYYLADDVQIDEILSIDLEFDLLQHFELEIFPLDFLQSGRDVGPGLARVAPALEKRDQI